MDIHRHYLTPHRSGGGRPARINPFFDLAETGVKAYRESVLPGHFHSVIFPRIVRRRDLHGGLETIVGGSEIDHWCSAQPDVVHIGPGVSYAFEKIFMYLVGRDPAVPPHKNFVGREKFWKEVTDLISCVTVKIHTVDSADVVCMKSSHGIMIYLIFVA